MRSFESWGSRSRAGDATHLPPTSASARVPALRRILTEPDCRCGRHHLSTPARNALVRVQSIMSKSAVSHLPDAATPWVCRTASVTNLSSKDYESAKPSKSRKYDRASERRKEGGK